ncbi:MAG: riboflavin synthase [Candidatus Eisenbacteria bacterium]|nr:riboflavin synthase [Candidatus Eisenbacteria bacterium]
MFTGLIEAKGRLRSVRRIASGKALLIEAPFSRELASGESVSVNGVCLTVTRCDVATFEADVARTTLGITTLDALSPGSDVNLERALRASDRLGGHVVTGHVDGVGTVSRVDSGRDGVRVTIELPRDLLRFVVARGSIAVDGVSLTVAEMRSTSIVVALIPETLRRTLASGYRVGTVVNIETDVLARHQARLSESGREQDGKRNRAEEERGITREKLRKLGFME